MSDREPPIAAIGVQDPRLAQALGQLFAEAQILIDRDRVDVVVLTARRLACVYDMLVRAGMKPLRGCPVVSDRYLELSTEQNWDGARILVLDDTVILGTTLYQLHQRLLAGQAAEVLFRAVALDAEQHATYLTDAIGLKALVHCSQAEVERFSLDLVRGLFTQGIPYFSDFVTTVPIRMTVEEWEAVVASPDWLVADVTAPLLDDPAGDPRHTAYSHLPHGTTLDGFLDQLPGGLAHLVDSFKVRSFVTSHRDSVEVVFVPLGLVRPVHCDHLDEILDIVAAHMGSEEDILRRLGCRTWTPEAKHRLIQFLVSVCGMAVFWQTLREHAAAEPLPAVWFARLPLDLHFGSCVDEFLQAMFAAVASMRLHRDGDPVLQPRIDEPSPSQLMEQPELGELLWRTREFLSQLTPPGKPAPGELTKIGIELTQPIVSIFGWIHANLEKQQREQIRTLGNVGAYERFAVKSRPRVLNEGLTGRELARALMPESLGADAWSRSLVMLGIDAGNDLGAVVPVTKVDESRGVVYRCYRLGETAYLADRPLVQSSFEDFDRVTRQAVKGFPVAHVTMRVADMFARRTHREDDTESVGYDALLALKSTMTPGSVVQRFDGEVVGIDDAGRLVAHLTDATDGEVEVRTVDREQFAPQVRDQVRVGSRFAWTLYEDAGGDEKRHTSVIRFHRPTTIDSAAMLARLRRSSGSRTEA